MKGIFSLKEKFVNWLLRDVHLQEGAIFGKNSISVGQGGNDLINFSSSGTPTALGDMAVDTTTGRIQGFVGGVATAMSTMAEGSWVLVSRTLVAVNTAPPITIASSIDGDTDVIYAVVTEVKSVTGNANYWLRPNSATSTINSNYFSFISSGTSVGANPGNMGFDTAYTDTAGAISFGVAFFFAAKSLAGVARQRNCLSFYQFESGVADCVATAYNVWTNTTTSITSLTYGADAGETIGAGSAFMVYKLRQSVPA